jgi:F-type H+-transporting ATPase subunit b
MDQILPALSGLLLKAIPTIVLLILLYIYLKVMLYAPLDNVLKQRAELTEGARLAAEKSLQLADAKQQEYEAKFRDARSEVYRAQEETRRQWLQDQATQVAEARKRSDDAIRAAKEQIAAEASDARQNLEGSSATLADEIAASLLNRKAGGAV